MNFEKMLKRFWIKVNRSGECWLWTASKDRKGYGKFGVNYMTQKSHRVSWEIHKGPIPKSLHVLHKCDNPSCVNPDHLFLGTIEDNNRDMFKKGRGFQQKKTHCPAGHPYNDANLRGNKQGTNGRCRCKERVAEALTQMDALEKGMK